MDSRLLYRLLSWIGGENPQIDRASAMLFQRYIAKNSTTAPDLVARFVASLSSTTHWEARLNLLQSLPLLSISSAQAGLVCDALLLCLTDRNKFVRAWTYNGLHLLASLFLKYRPEVIPLLQRAADEESAAVRVRLRQFPSFT